MQRDDHAKYDRKWIYPITVVLSAAVLASGLVALARSRNDASEPKNGLAALAPAPLAVTIRSTIVGGRVAMGAVQPIVVEAVGPRVAELRLWDGDLEVGRARVDRAATGAGHGFEWVAIRPGRHLLHASATGADGTAHSAPLPVEVFLNSRTPKALPVTTQLPMTTAALAAATGVPASAIAPGAPGTGEAAPADNAPHTTFVVDAPAAADAPASDAGGPSEPGGAAPTLLATVDDCTVSVRATATKGDLVVYRATSGSVGFTTAGETKGDESVRLGPFGPGPQVFVAGVPGEPTSLGPVEVDLPDTCVKTWWTGNASLVGGILTIAKATTASIWAFLSVDGQPAVRLPGDSLKTFQAATRRIDVSTWLPTLEGRELELEVWAYTPGDDEAVRIGNGHAELPEGTSPSDLIGESAASSLVVTPLAAKVSDGTWTAKWTALSPRVDRVVWQITTQPLGEGTVSLNPPGLVASGVSPASGDDPDGPATVGGTFTVPIGPVHGGAPTLISAEPLSLGLITKGLGSQLPVATPKLITDPTRIDLASLAADPITVPTAQGGLAPPPVISGSTYFFRVIPMAGTAPLGAASEARRVDLPTPQKPPQVAIRPTSVKLDPGRAANPDLRGCIRVTAIPWAADGSGAPSGPDVNGLDVATTYPFYRAVGTYCPGDWPPPDDSCWAPQLLCDAWDAVVTGVTWVVNVASKIWDLIAATYNGIIDLAVNLLSRFNPYCIQAALIAKASGAIGFKESEAVAGAASDFCDSIAPVIARAAIGSVLATFGLPPSLPNSEQLKAIAEGNLTELAVGYLKDLGVPCDDLVLDADTASTVTSGVEAAGGHVPDAVADGVDLCREAVGAALSAVKKQVVTQTQQQIRDATGLPLPNSPIPGFDFEIEPRSMFQPPSLTLKGVADEPPADPSGVCSAWLYAGFPNQDLKDPKAPTLAPVRVTMQRPFFSDTYSATARFPFKRSPTGDTADDYLGVGVAVRAEVNSDCLKKIDEADLKGFVSTPLGRWSPGQEN